jgi:hypothetical protein
MRANQDWTSGSAVESSRYDRARVAVGEAAGRTGDVIGRYPASSAMITFGAGCGLGIVMALLLAPNRKPPPRHSWSSWSAPVTRAQVSRAVECLVPEAVSRYLAGRK